MATVDDWLATPNRTQCVLIEFDYYDISATAEVTEYVSNMPFQTGSGDTPASKQYRVCLKDSVTINFRMGTGYTGAFERTTGEVILDNSDGNYDALFRDSLCGRDITIKIGDPSWTIADFGTVLDGRINTISSPDSKTIRLEIEDRSPDLDVPLQSTYLTSGPNEGKPEPISIGTLKNIEPVQVDDTTYHYYLGSAALHTTTNPDVKDGGVSLTKTSDNLNGAINDTVTTITVNSTSGFPSSGIIRIDLEYMTYTGTTSTTFTGCTRGYGYTTAASHSDNATVYGGDFVWNFSLHEIMLASAPVYRLTADILGEKDGASFVEYTQDALEYFLINKGPLSSGDVSITSDDDLATDENLIDMWITEQATILEVCQDLAKKQQFWFGFNRNGVFRASNLTTTPPTVPYTNPLDIVESNLLRDPSYTIIAPPRWQTKMGYDHNWTVLTRNELASSVSDADAAWFAEEYRVEVYTDSGNKTRHTNAVDVPFEETYISDQSPATLYTGVASRHGVWDQLLREITVVTDCGPMQVELGDWITIKDTASDLDGTEDLFVIGITESLLDNTVTFKVLEWISNT